MLPLGWVDLIGLGVLLLSLGLGLWLKRLRAQLAAGDLVLIVQIDPTRRSGLLPKWAWEWLAKQAVLPGDP